MAKQKTTESGTEQFSHQTKAPSAGYETDRSRENQFGAVVGDVGSVQRDRAFDKAEAENARNTTRDQNTEQKLPSDPIDPALSDEN